MRFDMDTLEAVRRDALLKFWGREVRAEVKRASRDSSETDSMLALLGADVNQETANAVMDKLVTSGFSDFLQRAPGIAPYFHRREESISRYLAEVIANANSYEERIAQELLGGKAPQQVLSVNQVGATYQGARGALIITTDAGKFLYKPHPMPYNSVLGELCDQLLPGKTHVPRVVDCGSACFCEFIESRPPANDAELHEYYAGLGGYLALAYFLSLSDQHAGNILCLGPKFAPIDVETILLAPCNLSESPLGPSKATLGIFGSVVGTNMLDYGHDYLSGSIVSGAKNAGAAPIGTRTEVINHLDVIERAFVETFRKCLQDKRLLCAAIRSLADTDLRIIMGPNKFYYGLQARFFKLEGWDEAGRLRDFDDLLRSPRRKKTNEAVFVHEHAILLEHDIPYFTLKAGGTDLMADGKIIWENYLSETPIDAAVRHVEQADAADMERQRGLLRKVISGMPLMAKQRVPNPQEQQVPLTQAAALEEAGWILQQLFDATIDFGPDGRALMAFGNAFGNYDPMDSSLAWGYAGVGCFAAACLLCSVGNADVAHDIVDMCLVELGCATRRLKERPDLLAIGSTANLRSGMAGYLRALQIIWVATHDDRAHQAYADLIALIDDADFSAIESQSALDGLSELAEVLSHATPGLPQGDCYEHLVAKCELASAPDARVPAHRRPFGKGGDQTRSDKDANPTQPDNESTSVERDEALPLTNCDDLYKGNAAAVEELIVAGRIEDAGLRLAAMVARRRKVGNYIHKGAWRVPYFDPTLFHGATGVGYELLRYARSDVVEPLFV